VGLDGSLLGSSELTLGGDWLEFSSEESLDSSSSEAEGLPDGK